MVNENRSEGFVLDIDGYDLNSLNHALRPFGVMVEMDYTDDLAYVVLCPNDASEPDDMS